MLCERVARLRVSSTPNVMTALFRAHESWVHRGLVSETMTGSTTVAVATSEVNCDRKPQRAHTRIRSSAEGRPERCERPAAVGGTGHHDDTPPRCIPCHTGGNGVGEPRELDAFREGKTPSNEQDQLPRDAVQGFLQAEGEVRNECAEGQVAGGTSNTSIGLPSMGTWVQSKGEYGPTRT